MDLKEAIVWWKTATDEERAEFLDNTCSQKIQSDLWYVYPSHAAEECERENGD